MEIPLYVLVLQIGFNAALNNRGYNGNLLIPSARFVNSGQTRRLSESDGYQPLSSRGIPASDSEQSDDEYSNFEDFSFRSVRSLQSSPNQRRTNYLRYNTGPENDVSLESSRFGRINSNDYVDSLQSSSSLSRRTDLNFRRPYLRNGQSNLRQRKTQKYYGKVNDDLNLEVSSLESSNSEDASRLEEEASYLRSLLSLIEQPNNRRGQNRNYYRKRNNLSRAVSPIDKLDPDEDIVNSLPSSPNRGPNYRKEYNNHNYDLRIREPSPEKDIPDAYIDTILLVTDDDKPDEIPIGRPELGSPESTDLGNNNLYNRRHSDGLNLDDDISNNLSLFRGLKQRLRSHKLTNDSPVTRRFNRKSNDNAGLESSLNDELFPDDDKTGPLTLLRLASMENLNLDSPLLRNRDRKKFNNRKSNRRNFLRLSLSPNNKLTLDESVASDLPELLSETLDELNLVPVTLRRTRSSNNKYSRRENNRLSVEEDTLSDVPVLRLGRVDIPNAELPLRRYQELANRSDNRNLRKHGYNRKALKKLFDPAKNLVPYHEVNSNKLPNNRRNEKPNNNSRDDFPDEFRLDTLFNFRKEDYDDRLDLDDKFSSDISVLRSTNQNHLSLERSFLRNSDENLSKSKDADDTLHLQFPRNDPLSSNGDKGKSQLSSQQKKDNTKDTSNTLHLEFPWNDQLSPNKSITGGFRPQAALRNTNQKYSTKDTTDTLHLEFPWNDSLSPNKNKTGGIRSQIQLRGPEQKDRTEDTTNTLLHLEFPWNDQLSSSTDSTSNLSLLRKLKSHQMNSKTKDNVEYTTYTLHLEFPWNDSLSSENDKSNKLFAIRSKSQIRNSKEKDYAKDTTDTLHLEFPWNDQLSPSMDKTSDLSALRKLKSQLRSPEDKDNTKDTTDTLHLEFPWNDPLSPENDKTSNLSSLRELKSQLRTPEQKYNAEGSTDSLHLEFPWNDALSPDETKTVEIKFQSLLRSQSDSRQEKEPKYELKLESPWNDKPSPDEHSSKETAARTSDLFYLHPHLRNRNIKKHPNYFTRSYDEFTEGIRLKKLKANQSDTNLRLSNRSLDGNESLRVLPIAREDLENDTVFRNTDKDPSAVITFPLDIRPKIPWTQVRGTLTTTERPNGTESILKLIGDKNDRITYNDSIIFPKN